MRQPERGKAMSPPHREPLAAFPLPFARQARNSSIPARVLTLVQILALSPREAVWQLKFACHSEEPQGTRNLALRSVG
jgi:hypothetical protein